MINEVKVETIETTSQPKWTEKIETIYPETIPVPDYNYGNSQNTLDYNIALRNKPNNSNNPKMWSFTITWTWNIVITWIWFKPKLVQFTATNYSWWLWNWKMNSTSQYSFDLKTLTWNNTECIYVRDSSSNVMSRAVYVSLDSDWFTINCTYFASNTTVIYTCF